jgi:hypothetical protein
MTMHSEQDSRALFFKFFWSTLLSLMGMSLYLFTHGWYLLELGGGKLSIGLSWAVFFLPGAFMLPVVPRLLKQFSIPKVQFTFEAAKAVMLCIAFIWLKLWPTLSAVYLFSACFGLLFAPFYPGTYALLKRLFVDTSVVKYSNLFEVSLQLSGALALFTSGFAYERAGFLGIVALSAVCLIGSCFFISKVKGPQFLSASSPESWGETYYRFFSSLGLVRLSDRRLWLGLLHQVPQNAILLSNIPIMLYVGNTMKAGPKVFGYLDSLYSLVAVAVSIYWSKKTKYTSSVPVLTALSLVGAGAYLSFAYFPAVGVIPYLLMSFESLGLTSAKIMSRAVYIETCSEEFVTQYTSFFQLVSNLSLVFGAFALGALLKNHDPSAGLTCLAVVMVLFVVGFAMVRARIQSVTGATVGS